MHGDAVAHPVHRAAKIATELILLCDSAVDTADLSKPQPMPAGVMGFDLNTGMDDDARKEWYKNWLMARGVRELARGVREMLQEAYFYAHLLAQAEGMSSWGDFQGLLAELRKQANKLNFPDLLAAVNATLTEPLHFEKEFLSLQAVRNCMEHRAGVVGPEDLRDGASELKLSLPRFMMFVVREGTEVELGPGSLVNAGEKVSMRRVVRERTYQLGDAINFKAEDLVEAAFGCYLFGADLVPKLPKKERSEKPIEAA